MEPLTCIMILSLSKGAVSVFPRAPAQAPAKNKTVGSETFVSKAKGLCAASQASGGSFGG
jgi:hypothetical protein